MTYAAERFGNRVLQKTELVDARENLIGRLCRRRGGIARAAQVLFGDALGETVRLSHYPIEEKLYSVGLGARFQTLIGPIRLEYGHNLNPRPGDPSGTLLFSIGYPF